MKVIVFDKETGEKSPEIGLSEFLYFDAEEIAQWRDLSVCFPERFELRPVLEGVEVYVSNDCQGVEISQYEPKDWDGDHFGFKDFNCLYWNGEFPLETGHGTFRKAKIVLEEEQ